MSTAWLLLIAAGLLEIVWAIGLKYTEGFSRVVPSVITIAAMIGSVWLLALALKSIPVGTGSAVWTGIGAVGAFLVGVWVLNEQVNAVRILAAILIVSGLVLMKLSSTD